MRWPAPVEVMLNSVSEPSRVRVWNATSSEAS
jgi:hypothetical protein